MRASRMDGGTGIADGLIAGESAMAGLVRAFDWRVTPLGALDTWSDALLSQVNFVLCSPSPSTLSWGTELTFFYNDAAIPTLGSKHPGALGRGGRDVFPESWDVMGPEMDACFLRGAMPVRANVCIAMLQNGRMEDAYFNYSLIPVYERGRIAGVHGAHENVTERMTVRLERDAVASQLAQVLEATSDGVVALNPEWLITYMNGRARTLLRADEGVLGTRTWASFPHQVYPHSPYVEYLERAMYQRIPGTFEAFYPEPLNVFVTLEVRPAREGVVVFIRDRTEAKRVEHELTEANSREQDNLLALFDQAPAFISVLAGPEHVFAMVNEAYRALLGGRALIGYRVRDCVPEVVGTGWIEILDTVYRTGIAHAANGSRLMLAPRPGEALKERFVDYVYQPRRNADGTIVGIIALGIDVTDKRRAEKALMQSEKLAVVGRLASSIAHEINNPLSAAMNYLYLARLSQEPRAAQTHIAAAEVELHRVHVISTQTLLSQRQASVPSATSLETLIEGILRLYQGRITAARVSVALRHRAGRRLLCVEGEVRQVLSNLIGNAVDAMVPDGGRLLLRSRSATDWKTGRTGCRVTIADTGEGMLCEVQGHVFDPFFTTKGALGNGLGLWITREIVVRHEGALRFRSVAGGRRSGTVFALFFPDPVA